MLEDYKLFGFDEDVLLVEHKIYEEIIASVSHTDTDRRVWFRYGRVYGRI